MTRPRLGALDLTMRNQLRISQPRFRTGQRLGAAGGEDVVLWDHVEELTGEGPNGNEVPVTRRISSVWYTFWPSGGYASTADADVIDMSTVFFAQQRLPSFDGYYHVSTVNPYSGTYHLRATTDYSTHFSTAGPGFDIGSEVTNANSFSGGYTGFPAVAGDYEWTMRAMQSGSTEPENEFMNRIVILSNPASGAFNLMHSEASPYPETYQLITVNFTITPAHVASYTHFYVSFDWDDERFTEPLGEIRHFDVDELVLKRLAA